MNPRIAILDAVADEYRGVDPTPDSDKFLTLLRSSGRSAEFEVFHVAGNEFPDVSDHDGFLITGSPASVHDGFDWILRLAEFVRQVDAARCKLVGSCFGHQLIATALGGEVGWNENGWMIGNYQLRILSGQPWMEPQLDATRLYHFNQERVTRLPEAALAYAESEDYPNSGYVIGNHILAVQGHPEQTADSLRNYLHKTEPGMKERELQLARKKIDDGSPDTRVWANWIMKFFLDP